MIGLHLIEDPREEAVRIASDGQGRCEYIP